MSARARRRRERAAALPAGARPARPALRLPLLPVLALGAGLVLLAAAWTTRWPPGPPRDIAETTRLTLQVPPAINSWERFFICYDLLDPAVVDLTLRANQRTRGTLEFPGEAVEVALPAADAGAAARERPESGAEEELIAARRAVLNAAVPERLAAVRAQCPGGTATPPPN